MSQPNQPVAGLSRVLDPPDPQPTRSPRGRRSRGPRRRSFPRIPVDPHFHRSVSGRGLINAITHGQRQRSEKAVSVSVFCSSDRIGASKSPTKGPASTGRRGSQQLREGMNVARLSGRGLALILCSGARRVPGRRPQAAHGLERRRRRATTDPLDQTADRPIDTNYRSRRQSGPAGKRLRTRSCSSVHAESGLLLVAVLTTRRSRPRSTPVSPAASRYER